MTKLQIENDSLECGDEIDFSFFDNHEEHIYSHQELIKYSKNKDDPEFIVRVLDHVQLHIDALLETCPEYK